MINLSEILVCFNSPIKEEQAWAVCHLCAKSLKSRETDPKSELRGPESIIFDKNGSIALEGSPCDDETDIVHSLGIAIFAALDYGLPADEEQVLSGDLEHLISTMTGHVIASDDETTDEGFDDKTQDLTVDGVITLCEKHLSSSTDASSHYEAVCRALVHEALELKVFLSKIASANECLQKLSANDKSKQPEEQETDGITSLNFTQWAHVWIQVLDQLRQGVTRLRKVEHETKMSIEYELTPYEILMEDIRQKKYTLKKVTSKEKLPSDIRRNAHDIILDFIKSRPNLSPAHERILNPIPPRSKSLHEQLLEQIQGQTVSLKHVDVTSSQTSTMKRTSSENNNVIQRRLLKLSNVVDDGEGFESDIEDLELYVSDDDVTGDVSTLTFLNDDSNSTSFWSPGVSSSSAGDLSSHNRRPPNLKLTQQKRRLPLELLPSPVQSPNETSQRRTSFFGSLFSSFRNPPNMRRSQSAFVQISSLNKQPLDGGRWGHRKGVEREDVFKNNTLSSSPFRRTFSERRSTPEKHSSTNVGCLSLTLNEVMHIREVLSRAQMEKFQSTPELYQALKNEKICFVCREKRFFIFSWPYTCQICQRKVCGNCHTKVRFPLDKFIETPVFSLGPAFTPIMLKKKEFKRSFETLPHCDHSSGTTQSSSRVKKMNVCHDCNVMITSGTLTDWK